MKKASILWEPIMKWIIVLVVVAFVFIFLLPKVLYGADKVLSLIGVSGSKCSFTAAKCANCLSITSSVPSTIEFRKSDNYASTSCEISSSTLALSFNENLKSQKVDILSCCGKAPKIKTDWTGSAKQLTISLDKNSLKFSGLTSNCYYRLSFGKDLISETGKNISTDQEVIVFKTK
ncbi:MAG: hypothetical protein V1837_07190 [Candidatus Woesearchaeota archaeon]